MKAVGCILLILGTSIGAGMLALPVAMAKATIGVTLLTFLLCWAAMTLGALSILEVNLSLPAGTNLISMAGQTLGRVGQAVTWLFYLLLLYSLLSAYLSGVGDIVQHLLCQIGLCWPRSVGTLGALVLLGGVVYCGLGSVDGLNRVLMSVKLLLLALILVACSTRFSLPLLHQGQVAVSANMILVVLTSFGFAIIVPSLREYLFDRPEALKRIVVIGSLLPLVIYAVWVLAIQGVIPRFGVTGLEAISRSSNVNSLLMSHLAVLVQVPLVSLAAKMFVSICVLTSFLGVSVCQVDFIADGVGLAKKGGSAVWVYGLAYLPPLVLVLFFPGVFIQALQYAGVCCVVILILMPMLMLYANRYVNRVKQPSLVPGGRFVISLGLLFGLAVLLVLLVKY